MRFELAAITLVTISTLLVFRRLYVAFCGPLKDIPGPAWAKLTRLWEVYALLPGDLEKKLILLHRRHGPIVRIGPNKCSIDDPAAVKIIYGLGKPFVKASFYSAFTDVDKTSLFSEKDPNVHAGMRRRIAKLYSLTNLLSYEGFVDQCTATLEDKFQKFCTEARPVDMGAFLQYYAFDLIGSITAGHPFGLMEREGDDGIIHQIHRATLYGSFVGIVPDLHYWYQKTLEKLRPYGVHSSRAELLDFVNFHIGQRRKGITPNDKNDFLTKLLALEEEGTNTHADTQVSCRSNIAAGSDTTAITLGAILYYLIQNPDKMQKLRDEIDQKCNAGELSDPVTFKQSQDMPYLQAVIKEGLRIHPAIAIVLARRVPQGGAKLSGKFLPEGTEVGINAWVAHHNESIFPDPATFRPERWLGPKEEVSKMDSYFASFGFGSRTCIGRHISFLEISKLVPQLVKNYDFELDPPQAEWTVKSYMFAKQKFYCKIKRR
ncbi:hypothetical protein AbraIFM66951_007510 [Aspergillus brasiliensis]|nr:hypothetical protein AbraIFM66951_007510 [Aspergillus brasiliensis]